MGDPGHWEAPDGAGFAVRNRSRAHARITAFVATAALHLLVLAAVISQAGGVRGGISEKSRHLVVISLPPPPARIEPLPDVKARSAVAPAIRQTPATRPALPMVLVPLPEARPVAAAATPSQQPEQFAERSPPPLPVAVPAETDAASLAQYQSLVWQHIAAHKPRGVQAKGTVTVKFQLDGNGNVGFLEVAGSSGNFNLDRIALRAIRRSGAFPKPPPPLGTRRLVFVVPVEFL